MLAKKPNIFGQAWEMSRAQFINKIDLTISESIARFGRFFGVELLRFNTCGFYQRISLFDQFRSGDSNCRATGVEGAGAE